MSWVLRAKGLQHDKGTDTLHVVGFEGKGLQHDKGTDALHVVSFEGKGVTA